MINLHSQAGIVTTTSESPAAGQSTERLLQSRIMRAISVGLSQRSYPIPF